MNWVFLILEDYIQDWFFMKKSYELDDKIFFLDVKVVDDSGPGFVFWFIIIIFVYEEMTNVCSE